MRSRHLQNGSRRRRISIRQMEIDDLPHVYHLGESLFTRTALPVLYRTWDPYEVTSAFNSDPEFCLVAEDEEGTIVGFALGSTVDKDGPSWRYGYLAWLGVKEEFQGTGVARRLLREFERRMRNAGVRMLIVDTEGDNAKALAFFQKNGFSRPTSHVWLTKSLSRPENGTLKPLKPFVLRRAKRTA
ncbi:MAG: GNAT family N-acetyltransferase [Dehalococcoidia bacterium]|nr:GNAT family N-acetyltransferase [Dehalococcoidia bacterium]MDW8119462.1 GNAT family N-acetyltransferase [Chloroflexota bacterium]